MNNCEHNNAYIDHWWCPDCQEAFNEDPTGETCRNAQLAEALSEARQDNEKLLTQLAEAREFIEFCEILTVSMWPQNETTARLAVALRQSPIVRALLDKGE